MESDEESEHVSDWSKLDSMKAFEWIENPASPPSNLLRSSPHYSLQTEHFDSSTQLVDNTPTERDNFIEQLVTKATAPVSLLVESLVQQLCSMIESDQSSAEHLYRQICNQLYRMNLIDETYKMGEFDVMRSQYQRALYQLATVARGQPEVPLNLQSVWPLSDSASMQWSRYHRDFDELNFVAGGGFGRVYRARNKLDGIEYAVKKVTIKYRTINRVLSHIAEVKTFASLNHNNVVPYKAAWLEPLFDDPSMNRPSVTGPKSLNKKRTSNRNRNGRNDSKQLELAIFDFDSKLSDVEHLEDDDSETETGSSESDFETGADKLNDGRNQLQLPVNNNHNEESSDFIQFQQSTHDDVVDGANVSAMASVKDKQLCKPKENQSKLMKSNLSQPHLKLKWATLYIQMSFRPLTLRAWLDERNKSTDFNRFHHDFIEKSVKQLDTRIVEEENDEANQNNSSNTFNNRPLPRRTSFEKSLSKTWNSLDVSLNIFAQALAGLQYIHMQNIVHHDIKPSNLFIGCEKDGELYVQLGDFGLACPLQAKHSRDSMIGTMTYAAPEQLRGHCNPKSDIYSLGIILLELLVPFNTSMERLKTIEEARKGNFPSNIPPKYLNLLKTLLQKHSTRPDAVQTFQLLSKLDIWNGNGGLNENACDNSDNDLRYKLTQVTDELNQLKMQITTSQAIHKTQDLKLDIPDVNIHCDNSSNTNKTTTINATKYSKSLHSTETAIRIEKCDKDMQIRILNDKLMESEEQKIELRKEVERLRDIINNQKNG